MYGIFGRERERFPAANPQPISMPISMLDEFG
jgi:hypothetical protein